MSTNITLDNISLNYFKSSDIKVFPCIYRDPVYDKESRLNTERNFTKLGSGGFGSRISYIKEWENNTSLNTEILYCNIGGYNFEINTKDYEQLLVSNKSSYLILKLDRTQIAVESAGSNTTYTYRIGTLDSENSSVFLDHIKADENSYFTGLGYFAVGQDSDISGLEITIEDNPSAEYLYYLLQIGKAGQKATESFLPEIDTLENGGIKIRDLEIIDHNNTTAWLSHYLETKPGISLNISDNDNQNNIVIGLDLANETAKVLESGFNNLSNASEALNLPLAIFKVKDANGNEFSRLGVQIPKNRVIYIKDSKDNLKQLPEGSNLLFDHQGGIQLDIKKDSEGRDTLSIGSRYTNPLFKEGLAIATIIEPNGTSTSSLHVPRAGSTSDGVVKVSSVGNQITMKELTTPANESSRNYSIKANTDNLLYVTVPWKNYDLDIANLWTEIADLKNSLDDGPSSQIPYNDEPYAELLLNNTTVASNRDGSYKITQPLSNYKLRIYHNMIPELASTVIDISTATNKVNFTLVNTANQYKEYSLTDLGLTEGTNITEKFIIIINYMNGYGENKGSSAIKWELSYNLPIPEILPNRTGDPIIAIVNPEDIEIAELRITTKACVDIRTSINYCTCEIIRQDDGLYNMLSITNFEEIAEGVWSAKLNQYKSSFPTNEFNLVPHAEVFYDGQEPESVFVEDDFTLNFMEEVPDILWSTNIEDVSWNIYIINRNKEEEDFLHYPSLDSNIVDEWNYDQFDGSFTFVGDVDTTRCQPLHLDSIIFKAPPAIAGAAISGAEFKYLYDATTHVLGKVSLLVSGNTIKYEGLSELLRNNYVKNPLDGENTTVDLSFRIIYTHKASEENREFNVNIMITYHDKADGISVD